jgi:hypothetical protein
MFLRMLRGLRTLSRHFCEEEDFSRNEWTDLLVEVLLAVLWLLWAVYVLPHLIKGVLPGV